MNQLNSKKRKVNLLQIIRFVTSQPLTKTNKIGAMKRFLSWQLASRMIPHPIIVPFVGDSKIILKRGLTGATGNYYVGLHEFQDMAFLLHLLQPEDMFFDIGANVGSYTILASAVKKARAVAIEPIPETYVHLVNNLKVNHTENLVKPLNIGLGGKEGALFFTCDQDTTNHVLKIKKEGAIEVPIKTLDQIAANQCPHLMKIDVEGFEYEVLRGGKQTLENPCLKAIIIELNGSGGRYGFNENEIHQKLLDQGFKPNVYDPFRRECKEVNRFGTHNTIYLRDKYWVLDRIQNAPKIEVLGVSM